MVKKRKAVTMEEPTQTDVSNDDALAMEHTSIQDLKGIIFDLKRAMKQDFKDGLKDCKELLKSLNETIQNAEKYTSDKALKSLKEAKELKMSFIEAAKIKFSDFKDATEEAKDEVEKDLAVVKNNVSDVLNSAKEEVSDAAEFVQEKANATVSLAKEEVIAAKDIMKEKTKDAIEATMDHVANTMTIFNNFEKRLVALGKETKIFVKNKTVQPKEFYREAIDKIDTELKKFTKELADLRNDLVNNHNIKSLKDLKDEAVIKLYEKVEAIAKNLEVKKDALINLARNHYPDVRIEEKVAQVRQNAKSQVKSTKDHVTGDMQKIVRASRITFDKVSTPFFTPLQSFKENWNDSVLFQFATAGVVALTIVAPLANLFKREGNLPDTIKEAPVFLGSNLYNVTASIASNTSRRLVGTFSSLTESFKTFVDLAKAALPWELAKASTNDIIATITIAATIIRTGAQIVNDLHDEKSYYEIAKNSTIVAAKTVATGVIAELGSNAGSYIADAVGATPLARTAIELASAGAAALLASETSKKVFGPYTEAVINANELRKQEVATTLS